VWGIDEPIEIADKIKKAELHEVIKQHAESDFEICPKCRYSATSRPNSRATRQGGAMANDLGFRPREAERSGQ
jgi:hypothetical protein